MPFSRARSCRSVWVVALQPASLQRGRPHGGGNPRVRLPQSPHTTWRTRKGRPPRGTPRPPCLRPLGWPQPPAHGEHDLGRVRAASTVPNRIALPSAHTGSRTHRLDHVPVRHHHLRAIQGLLRAHHQHASMTAATLLARASELAGGTAPAGAARAAHKLGLVAQQDGRVRLQVDAAASLDGLQTPAVQHAHGPVRVRLGSSMR